MGDVTGVLVARLGEAFATVSPGADPVLRPSDHADFQANGALALGKRLGMAPREVARQVVGAARLDDVCQTVEISGPGFINLVLSNDFLAARLVEMARSDRLGTPPAELPETVLIDYSAPNMAKEMHVGHLRSTVIGDSLCRLFGFLGHRVVRENHVGDWGTPFGMLIEHLLDTFGEGAQQSLDIGDLDEFYRQARASFDADGAFRERSRLRVVLLQSGDPHTLTLWQELIDESLRHFHQVYQQLGVLLTDDDIAGESRYQPMLAEVVRDLSGLGLLVEHDGARCVFPPGYTNRRGDPLPLIVQKSGGGFGYAATDLAAIRDRVDRIGSDRMLYVVGSPQSQHLSMCFDVARMAGWLPEDVRAVHVAFGSVLGQDRKMFASRSGSTVKLAALLDEAVERADRALSTRGYEGDRAERHRLARALGIGAVKYADLSTERLKDYVFDWDRMLAFEGNTAPYLQYAYARIRSIFRRTEDESPATGPAGAGARPPLLDAPHERELAVKLLGFDEAVTSAAASYAPSRLSSYLFDLSTVFTGFYEHCPVLRADHPEVRRSRLLLAGTTARVLERGLGLLGIEAPARM